MKLLWCITGAGEFLKESIEVMTQLDAEIDLFISRAGEEVLRKYKLSRELKKTWHTTFDSDFSASTAGKITLGKYDALVVSPATANTVAKAAAGIADNLVTTAISLALKSGVSVYMVPTDWFAKKAHIPDILTPGGSSVHMKPRKADLRNLKYLEEEGITLLDEPKKLLKELK